MDAAQRAPLFDELYARFTGMRDSTSTIWSTSTKRLIMRRALASEINVLPWQLDRLSERDRRYRDFTLNSLRDALREVIACFPVYRTYIDGQRGSSSRSATAPTIEIAVARRQAAQPGHRRSVFEFIRDVAAAGSADPIRPRPSGCDRMPLRR